MTDTATEEVLLFRAILADPDDDTVRLAYADWLEENGEADRAELVRRLVEYGGLWYGQLVNANTKRIEELIRARPEWSLCPCPVCGGKHSCGVCQDTGDLLYGGGGLVSESRVTGWSRGFPVVGCTLAELSTVCASPCRTCRTCGGRGFVETTRTQARCPDCSGPGDIGPLPTPWAKALVASGVRFVELVPTDRVPVRHTLIGWGWSSRQGDRPHRLPDWLLPKIKGKIKTDAGKEFKHFRFFPSRDAAKAALGRACARWLYRAAQGTI